MLCWHKAHILTNCWRYLSTTWTDTCWAASHLICSSILDLGQDCWQATCQDERMGVILQKHDSVMSVVTCQCTFCWKTSMSPEMLQILTAVSVSATYCSNTTCWFRFTENKLGLTGFWYGNSDLQTCWKWDILSSSRNINARIKSKVSKSHILCLNLVPWACCIQICDKLFYTILRKTEINIYITRIKHDQILDWNLSPWLHSRIHISAAV